MPSYQNKVRVFLDDLELKKFTDLTLSRTKNGLTSSLSLSLFFTEMLNNDIFDILTVGKSVKAYINDALVFSGETTTSHQISTDFTSRVNPTGFSISLECRGSTYNLCKSSHLIEGNYLEETTNKSVIEKLVEPFGINLKWDAEIIQLPFHVLRDGGLVLDELAKICAENCHYFYEDSNGDLIVSDYPKKGQGVVLEMGKNILSFSQVQTIERVNSHITVKGHKNNKHDWGEQKILDVKAKVQDKTIKSFAPLVLQHYGHVTESSLKKRAKWEFEKKKTLSRVIIVEVMSFGATDIFDIGKKHQVRIPFMRIDTEMECIEITYTLDANNTFKTQLVLTTPVQGKESLPKKGGDFDLETYRKLLEKPKNTKDLVEKSEGVGKFDKNGNFIPPDMALYTKILVDNQLKKKGVKNILQRPNILKGRRK